MSSSSGSGSSSGGGSSSNSARDAQPEVTTAVFPASNGLSVPPEFMDTGPNAHLTRYRMQRGADGLITVTKIRPNVENQQRAARIALFRQLMGANEQPEQRINYEAYLRYYDEGGRLPRDDEELWAFNGELTWGRFRTPEDFPPGVYWDRNIVKFCDAKYLDAPMMAVAWKGQVCCCSGHHCTGAEDWRYRTPCRYL
ncbi:hypothetical protein B0T26DRAFT_675427 [Lasiosphaeria miniovina]|uniref:Uncharacterized protein n=1 Tax=Lasiosphaeria miniovina TaxID=1954250 RepID=A0AA40DXB0_9PEZI|nr:uncharacterized protein B0T26DRAFT_675427 [Lasiosphaeria miniovina]KAK0717052.1 hypothetical protein B0T26DRAFT_675427 [Lasiosphaeria miniovina]